MGSITDFLELELLDYLCNAAYPPPTSVFVALCTADPTDTATTLAGIEVSNSGAAYARTGITFSAAASRQVVQSGNVQFPQAPDPDAIPQASKAFLVLYCCLTTFFVPRFRCALG